MKLPAFRGLAGAFSVGLLLVPTLARADEGMWLYNGSSTELLALNPH